MPQYRQFTSSTGTVWKVYRVEPGAVSESLSRLREHLVEAESERRRPWLFFESSAGERRRLTPVPAGWDDTCTDAQLAAWCEAADTIPPAPARRAEDEPPSSNNSSDSD
jgi:hypothetical protein